MGFSLFASNIGSEHFIGLSGSGAAAGIGVGAFEFNVRKILMLIAKFLLNPLFKFFSFIRITKHILRNK